MFSSESLCRKDFRWFQDLTQKEIGETIRERQKKLGINQQTLADLAGVAVNTVVAIERGEGNPQLTTLLTILDTLGLQADINLKQLEYERIGSHTDTEGVH